MTARIESSLPAQLDRMARAHDARKSRYVLKDERVSLSHGAGGKASHQLLEGLIFPALASNALLAQDDAAVLALGDQRLAYTTDSYVVSPIFFPGGDIGSLSVHGTVNDLAMQGARPLALSVAIVLEEGFETVELRRVLESMAAAARASGIEIVTGDTKVVPRGKADRIFITTSGVGVVPPGVHLSMRNACAGDRVLVSGAIGDHGIAVMLAREALELESEIRSDSAPLADLVAALLVAAPGTRALKDPTRGGVATALNEIAEQAGVGIAIDEEHVPVHDAVRGACEILGLDPMHIANEGKLIAIVPPDEADAALGALRAHSLGSEAAIVGDVTNEHQGMVIVRTGIGGSRVLDMLVGDPLPRIC
ncbi:MAG: hydrogenase expression/formation protein HypE [Gemmatimonadota bacterium]|nr:hydrogenase expression/formation protein HypE [Gemmatimonadota bacterium]